MTFDELRGKLKARPSDVVYSEGISKEKKCSLPSQVHHDLMEIPGIEILTDGVHMEGETYTGFRVPLDDGHARIFGVLALQNDGSQRYDRCILVYSPEKWPSA